jgi:hypothetical protein
MVRDLVLSLWGIHIIVSQTSNDHQWCPFMKDSWDARFCSQSIPVGRVTIRLSKLVH